MFIELYKKDREIYVNGKLVTKIRNRSPNMYFFTDSYDGRKQMNQLLGSKSPSKVIEYRGISMEECFEKFIQESLPEFIEDILDYVAEFGWARLEYLNSGKNERLPALGKDNRAPCWKVVHEHKRLLEIIKDFTISGSELSVEFAIKRFEESCKLAKVEPYKFTDIIYEVPKMKILNDLLYYEFISVNNGVCVATEMGIASFLNPDKMNTDEVRYTSASDFKQLNKRCLGCKKTVEWYGGTYCISCKKKRMGTF